MIQNIDKLIQQESQQVQENVLLIHYLGGKIVLVGKAPVGSRGWNSNGACNKWYQHISGELLCSDYKTNFDKPIKGPCVTAIGILDPSEETRRFVSNTLTSILDIVGLYPGAVATLKTISCILLSHYQLWEIGSGY